MLQFIIGIIVGGIAGFGTCAAISIYIVEKDRCRR